MSDDFSRYYSVIAQRNTPLKANPANFSAQCIKMLQARKLIYFKKVPGDCPTQNVFSSGQLTATKLAGSAASGTLGILGGAGVIGGVATAGIGIGVSAGVAAIEEIFQHHARAVATEQETLCQVTDIMNQVLAALDSAVIAGSIDAGEAQSVVKTYANQAIASLAGIKNNCNAACYYQGYIDAQVDFRSVYWPKISPLMSGGAVSNPALGSSLPIKTLGPPVIANTTLGPPIIEKTVPSPTYRHVAGNEVNAALPVASSTVASSNFWPYMALGVLVLILLMKG